MTINKTTMAINKTTMATNKTTMTTDDATMASMDGLWMVSFTRVGDLHNCATISTISMVGHVLDTSIWKGNCVFTLNVASSIS